jgi:hypothetical protein
MSSNGDYPTFADAKNLLPGAVFLPVDSGTKKPKHNAWQKTNFQDTQRPEYQDELEKSETIGILLGPPSGSLIDIDCDCLPFLARMLELNPALRDTLQTYGRRGGGLWLFLKGNYPERVHHLLVSPGSPLADGNAKLVGNKVEIGEFRGGCGQSIICGRRPGGGYYGWPCPNPPICLRFSDIIWPVELELPWLASRTESRKTEPQPPDRDNGVLRRAIAIIDIEWLWNYFGYPERRSNPTHSPFREDRHPSFSIYDDKRRWKDHAIGDGGDSFDFYQRARKLDASAAFRDFVTLAGLEAELRQLEPHQEFHDPEPEPSVHGTNGKQPPPVSNKKPELILPSGNVTFSDTASAMFPVLAKRLRYFVRGRVLVEIAYQKLMKEKQLHDIFQLLEPDALRSRIEDDFNCRTWRDNGHGKYVKKHGRCTGDAARVLLKTDVAFEYLPPIATLSVAPVLTGEQGNLQILYNGYHDIHGGIYITGKTPEIVLPSLEEAIELILEILRDYDFISASDKSRAVASFLSPAMRTGRLLGEADFPIDIGEGNDSQSGKTFRQKLVYTIYGETPYIIANRDGGVGSLDESISSALIAGVPFIFFENFRGQMKSQLVETCLRGAGMAPARAPHKGEIQVPTGHINWQLSSNGLEAPRDFVNRAMITRIAKREPGYKFHVYPEGNILAHIKANPSKYLAAIFRILIDWDQLGRQQTDATRHDFVEWTQALDWIVQKFFNLAPLLDGHVEEVLRVSDAALSWLRLVAIAVDREKRLDEALLATEIVDICQARGVELPGVKGFILDPDQLSMYAGRLLNRLFRDTEELTIDRYKIRRDSRRDAQKNYTKHYHWFELKTAPFGPGLF